MTDQERLAAEQRARVLIDWQLTEAGWVVQDRRDLNLFAGQGVALQRTWPKPDRVALVPTAADGPTEPKSEPA